jgi:heterodisulfide reductase subunit B
MCAGATQQIHVNHAPCSACTCSIDTQSSWKRGDRYVEIACEALKKNGKQATEIKSEERSLNDGCIMVNAKSFISY